MTIFGVMLGVCAAAYVHISRIYYKGIASSKAQDATRKVVTELSNRLMRTELMGPHSLNGGANNEFGFCIGDDLYYYQIGTRVGDADLPAISDHVFASWPDRPTCQLWVSNPADPKVLAPPASAQELVDSGISIHSFTATSNSVAIVTAYGPMSTIEPATIGTANVSCQGGVDSKFCGLSSLFTFVDRRL